MISIQISATESTGKQAKRARGRSTAQLKRRRSTSTPLNAPSSKQKTSRRKGAGAGTTAVPTSAAVGQGEEAVYEKKKERAEKGGFEVKGNYR
jgi:hypothetical protein